MEIDELRRAIDEVDRDIVRLIARRFEMVKKIAELKIIENRGISDDERESHVRMNWRKHAIEYGIPTDLVEELANLLIKYSKAYQVSLKRSSKVAVRNIAVIGYGDMARVLAKQLSRAGHRIVISGRSREKAQQLASELRCEFMDEKSALEEGEYAILALSLNAFLDGYVDRISPYFKGRTVMDILSAKGKVFNYLERRSIEEGFRYISLHPLFGPLTAPFGEKIAVIPSKTGIDVIQEVIDLWNSAGIEPIVVGFEEHEKTMAVVQVLTHLYLMAFLLASEELAKEYDVNPDKLSTPTYREVKGVAKRLRYIEKTVLEIQKNNLFSTPVRRKALETLVRIIKSVGDGE